MKKYFIGSMAVTMAIAASAFTVASNKTNKTTAGYVWYQYDGTGQDQASSYSSPTASPTCNSTNSLCEVRFAYTGATPPSNPSQADVDSAQTHINDILTNQTTDDATVRLQE